MPYGYYQILRVLLVLACVYLAFASSQKGITAWVWVFAGFALVYNPITPLSLGRELWSAVNVVTAILLFVHLRIFRRIEDHRS